MRRDELFDEGVRIVLETERGSVSLLQRRLNIGYARASRIIEMMAASGVLGEYKGSQAREVMMTLKEYERIREQMEAEGEAGYGYFGEAEGSSKSACRDSILQKNGKMGTPINEGQRGYVAVNEDDS